MERGSLCADPPRCVAPRKATHGAPPRYVFEGQAQTLDHQFVSRQLERDLERVRVAHINADWPADFAADGARGASDHDPVASRFEFPSGRGHGKGKGRDDDDDQRPGVGGG